jgi:hypothetical protein
MREDMFKVIVERPRAGSARRMRRQRLAGPDDLPTKIGMKRHVEVTRTRSKWLNENLAPLRRYLAKQVGRPWNKVYSEICANLDADHAVKQHVRDHLEDFVAYRLGVGRDGEWLDSVGFLSLRDMRWHQPFYVDPVDGLLKDSAKLWRKQGVDPCPFWQRRRMSEPDPDIRWLGDDAALQRIDGLWFTVTYTTEPVHAEDTHVYDVVMRRPLPAGQRYATAKRQLSGRELKEHGLSNGDCANPKRPQRHRKRKKS